MRLAVALVTGSKRVAEVMREAAGDAAAVSCDLHGPVGQAEPVVVCAADAWEPIGRAVAAVDLDAEGIQTAYVTLLGPRTEAACDLVAYVAEREECLTVQIAPDHRGGTVATLEYFHDGTPSDLLRMVLLADRIAYPAATRAASALVTSGVAAR